MRGETVAVWVQRVAWALLPFALGGALAEALDAHARRTALVGGVALWSAWTLVLVASLVPHPVSLTVLRSIAPLAPLAALAAAAEGSPSVPGLLVALAALVAAFMPELGIHHVNGPAYPNERRYPLRIPGAVLLGLPLTWLVATGLPVVAIALVAAAPVWGVALVVVSAAALRYLGRALHRLSRRWLVFVPAGVVLHDHLALADPVLFPKRSIASLVPAPAETTATDLTLAATGLALELALKEPTALGKRVRGRALGEELTAAAILFTPTRPGAVVRDAAARGVPGPSGAA